MNEYKTVGNIKPSESENEHLFPTHSSIKNKDELKNYTLKQTSSEDKDLLRPLNKSSMDKYKKEDLIKIHEFRRENIRDSYQEIEGKDFFIFTSEDDPKYKFVNVEYMLRSKLLIKAIYWSFGIGCAFFAHRYYRKQMFWPALRWGGITWSLSMLGIWGSLEFSPHLMAIFHSQFIKDLSMKDQAKYKRIGNIKQEEMLNKSYFDNYGVKLKYSQNTNCEIAKVAYDYDSLALQLNDYAPLKTQNIIKQRQISEEDLFSEDFDEKEIAKQLDTQDQDFDYDFSFHKETKYSELCSVKTDKFFELERKDKKKGVYTGHKSRFSLLKNDVLSKTDVFEVDTNELLKKELINAENFMNGEYDDLDKDPDYRYV
jgi:hypothetical protein